MNPPAIAYQTPASMIVESTLLGSLEAAPEEVFDLPQGLFGFPACHSFLLLRAEREGLYWLQSTEHAALVFLLIDPFVFFPGYGVDVNTVDLRSLDARHPDEISILAIVTLPDEPDEPPTANLQGPLALNLGTRLGKQIAFDQSEFGVRCAFDIEGAPAG